MDFLMGGGSIFHPPLLDGTLYEFWKARMRCYIKSIDEKAWRCILVEWKPPTKIDKDGNIIQKEEVEWDDEECEQSTHNQRALNAIFGAVDLYHFAKIHNCITAKSAWDELQTALEVTTTVREQRLEIITANFESLVMRDPEKILNFRARLCKIAGESEALGVKIPEEKLVRKVLRSLPPRFAMKVAVVKETKNLKTLRLDELLGDLITYELELESSSKPIIQGHGGATVSRANGYGFQTQQILQSRNNFQMQQNLQSSNNIQMQSLDQRGGENLMTQKYTRPHEMDNSKYKFGVKRRERDGDGHYQLECPNTKRKGKSFTATRSDDESDDDVSETIAAMATSTKTQDLELKEEPRLAAPQVDAISPMPGISAVRGVTCQKAGTNTPDGSQHPKKDEKGE